MEDKSWDELGETLGKVWEEITVTFHQCAELLTKVWEEVLKSLPSLEEIITSINAYHEEWNETVEYARENGLVSDRVIYLTNHRKARVAKKNMNRIKREVKLYGKRSHGGSYDDHQGGSES